MKTLTIIGSVIVVFLGLSVNSSVDASNTTQYSQPMFISCIMFPYCGGTDFTSPVVQPKDPKTETQDAKDEKVA